MISIETVVSERFPDLETKRPLFRKTLIRFLRFLCHEREFKQFETDYPHLEGFDFVEQVLKRFEFSYRVKDSELARIPSSGRVVIIANHPIGSLDGLALLKMVGEIRPDVRVVANELLYALKPLRSLLLPVDNLTNRSRKQQLKMLKSFLDEEGAIIIFPAGEVSRMGPTGVKDGRWNSGFLRIAASRKAPILPMFVDGRNSIFFYSLSLLAKPISSFWLIREMFKQANNHIDISVGHMVYPEQYELPDLNPNAVAKLFKKHVYRLSGRKKTLAGFAPAAEAISHPENRKLLKQEITQCELLGTTSDGKEIFHYRYRTNSVIMREIGRLRELTFRAVKEGTGKCRDNDLYDQYYDHLVLWDDKELEIVGAYRMVRSAEALADPGINTDKPLYSQTLFDYSDEFMPYFQEGLELGRSFVQPRYWGRRSLDYLWQGIGAYLRKYPEIRYLFGPVSISHEYPDELKDMLICFYSMHFGAGQNLASATNPYPLGCSECLELTERFRGENYREEFSLLKQNLAERGMSVPTLYKQYTELCEAGGVQFAAFNIDRDFSDCVDGLIIVDLHALKDEKRRRYIGP